MDKLRLPAFLIREHRGKMQCYDLENIDTYEWYDFPLHIAHDDEIRRFRGSKVAYIY